jgi:hypothetical protein
VNRWYPEAKDAIATAGVNLTSADIRLQLVSDSATYAAVDEFLDDLGANLLGTAQQITGRTVTAGVWATSLDSVTVDDVAAAAEVAGYVLYVHTGTASTSRLLCWIDTKADGTAFAFTAAGADIIVELPTLGNL